VRRNFGALLMQQHNVNVAKRVELAPAVSAKSNKRQGHLSLAISTSRCGRCSTKDVSQQNINQFRSTRANLASASTSLVPQAQPVLFNLQKFFV
jgi:hypothetical protein